jgi:hypothetical protein
VASTVSGQEEMWRFQNYHACEAARPTVKGMPLARFSPITKQTAKAEAGSSAGPSDQCDRDLIAILARGAGDQRTMNFGARPCCSHSVLIGNGILITLATPSTVVARRWQWF